MTNYNPEIHHRHSIRLQGYDYSQSGAYFITINTDNHICLFGDIVNGEMVLNAAGSIAEQWWLEIPNRYSNVELDEFVIMPNHVHGILIVGAIHELPLQTLPLQTLPLQTPLIQTPPSNDSFQNSTTNRRKMLLPKMIGYFKMNSAKQINQICATPGVPVWQRNYYEHIIRNENDLANVRQYIFNNPIKWVNDENYIP